MSAGEYSLSLAFAFLTFAWLCRGKPNDLTEGIQVGFLVCGLTVLIFGGLLWAVDHVAFR